MSIGSTLIDLEPDSNGWVRTKDEGLLFWLPEDYRIGFTSPAVTVFPNDGRHRVVRLDLSEFCFGTSWMDILK
ncbi:hypothetical protein CPB86DRAFT_719565 [Serendipita vermifera]|nr:hypothetical protein CPB86DRAFT_719565 [Serendipita vermifera]